MTTVWESSSSVTTTWANASFPSTTWESGEQVLALEDDGAILLEQSNVDGFLLETSVSLPETTWEEA